MDSGQLIQQINKYTVDLQSATVDSDIVRHLKDIYGVYMENVESRESLGEQLATNGFISHIAELIRTWQEEALMGNTHAGLKVEFSYRILWNYSDSSTKFAKAIADAGINVLLSENLLNARLMDNVRHNSVEYEIITSTTSIIWNMIRRRNQRFFTLNDEDKVGLLQIAVSDKLMSKALRLACMLSFICEAADNEMAIVDEDFLNEIISDLLQFFNEAMLANDHHMNERDSDGISTSSNCWSVEELLQGVAALARFPDQRKTMTDCGVLPLIMKVCKSPASSVSEVESALEAVQEFCTDCNIRKTIKTTFDLDCRLQDLLQNSSITVTTLANDLLRTLALCD